MNVNKVVDGSIATSICNSQIELEILELTTKSKFKIKYGIMTKN